MGATNAARSLKAIAGALLAACAIALCAAMPGQAWAATTVSDSAGLKSAIENGETEITLNAGEYQMPDTAKGKTLTINGGINDASKCIIEVVPAGQGEANGQLDYSLDGSTVTFNGVTIKTNNNTYAGYTRLTATYNNCVIENHYSLQRDSVFNSCILNVSGDQYNVWTWGAPNVTFNSCTFNSDGKALMLYGTANTKLTVNGCTFNDKGGLTDLKAAIEIGNDYGKSYELVVSDTVVNGYEINDKGINTGTTLWANKNSMSGEKLTVVVDEKQVYPAVAAKVGDKSYETLSEAVGAANAAVDDGGDVAPATVTLLKDVTLGEMLTITGNVTIVGAGHTITRADDYAGILFKVGADAALTLDGDLTIDGANEYAFDAEAYEADLEDWENSVPADASTKWFTPEEGAPVATAYMITTSGTVNLNDVSIKNHYSTNGSGLVSASKGAKVTLDGAQITHNASTSGSGLVVNASAGVWSRENELITVTMNEGTIIDGNHVGGNHGVFKVYMGTYFTMNGGTIANTTGWNSNGVAVGIYHAVFTMNGGTICSNSSVVGPNNGRNAAIYGHSNHLFTMNDGTVCHNTGRSKAGIDSPYSDTGYTGQTVITGGTVADNTILGNWSAPDVSGGATLTITGGTFTQDVSQWLAPDAGLVYDEEAGTYGLTKDLYEYNGASCQTMAEVVDAVKGGSAAGSSDAPIVTVLASHKVDDAIVADVDMVLDLNGKTITGTAKDGVQVYPVIRVQNGADVTVRDSAGGGGITNGDYVFVLGSSDGSSEGNLTIESGRFHGATTAASVTKGELTVSGGEFSVDPYIASEGVEGNYDFLLNCIDANYGNGSAKIAVKGGTFHSFNPADNAAEGAGTNFVAEGYKSLEGEDGTWEVVPTHCKATFVANGGSEVDSQTVEYGVPFAKPDDPTREGYTFAGWFADEALTAAYDFDTPATKDITLYAKWTESSAGGNGGGTVDPVPPTDPDKDDTTDKTDSKSDVLAKTGDAAGMVAAGAGIALAAAGAIALIARRRAA